MNSTILLQKKWTGLSSSATRYAEFVADSEQSMPDVLTRVRHHLQHEAQPLKKPLTEWWAINDTAKYEFVVDILHGIERLLLRTLEMASAVRTYVARC